MTGTAENPEQRLEALETRLTYQDDTIDKLNAAITEQWARIDALNRQVGELRERLREAEAGAPAAPANETPPHY